MTVFNFDDPFDGEASSFLWVIPRVAQMLAKESDYGCCMMTGALMDAGLKNLITQLCPNAKSRKMFGDRKLLGNLASKIDFLHAMNVFTKDDFDLFTTVRQIRNCFGHPTNAAESFESPSTKLKGHLGKLDIPSSTQAKLTALGAGVQTLGMRTPKMQYIAAVATLTVYLASLRRAVKPLEFGPYAGT